MKQNIQTQILSANMKIDSGFMALSGLKNGNSLGPPKKTVTKTALAVIMAVYSAIKKRENLMPLYSV